MSIQPALLTSKSSEHGTPHSLLKALTGAGYNIYQDVCASPGRAVAPYFFAPPDSLLVPGDYVPSQTESDYIKGSTLTGIDAFTRPWTIFDSGSAWNWMNPPYGRTIGKWLAKAHSESRLGARTLALIPARTDTKWWHEIVALHEVWFFRGRLKFRDAAGLEQDPAPFPSALVFIEPDHERRNMYVDATLKFGDPMAKLNQGRYEVIRVTPPSP